MKYLKITSGIIGSTAVALTSFFVLAGATKPEANEGDNQAMVEATQSVSFLHHAGDLYRNSQLKKAGLDSALFNRALAGYVLLQSEGKTNDEKPYLTIIDFSKASTKKRMWIVDLANQKLMYHTWVAHGKNTGHNMATTFSNTPNSNMSSLGFYVTGDTYHGKHGLSGYLHGQEPGFNDNAFRRAVVIHGADYVNPQISKQLGRLGRSFGCPAVMNELAPELIGKIAGGSVMFIYANDKTYNVQSQYNNLQLAVDVFKRGQQTADMGAAKAADSDL